MVLALSRMVHFPASVFWIMKVHAPSMKKIEIILFVWLLNQTTVPRHNLPNLDFFFPYFFLLKYFTNYMLNQHQKLQNSNSAFFFNVVPGFLKL